MSTSYDYDTVIESYKTDENFKKYLYAELKNKDKKGHSDYFLAFFSKNSSFNPFGFSERQMNDEDTYQKWRDKIFNVLENDYAISGEKSSIEDYIADTINNINEESIITTWLNKLYLDAMDSSKLKIGILHVLSHIDYKQINPVGQIIALAGLTDSDDEVIEYSIKAFENWQNKDAVRLLKGRQLKKPWLQEYLNVVVKYLEDL